MHTAHCFSQGVVYQATDRTKPLLLLGYESNAKNFIKKEKISCQTDLDMVIYHLLSDFDQTANRLHGQAVKTPPFHGGNRGSNPLGVINVVSFYQVPHNIIIYGDLAKW